MTEADKLARFEQAVLPHLDAAHNLARWLARNDHDAEDVVQEAYLRAFHFFEGFHGEDGRAWLLKIVRNTYYTWLERNRRHEAATAFDEEIHSTGGEAVSPEAVLVASADSRLLWAALNELPAVQREALVLRELEGLSYKEIAEIAGIPAGTVMSRLARAREALKAALGTRLQPGLAARAGKESQP
ncbi:MAG TPA: sigma-70 family RNA polymerase sigma factor [Bryobacterales bacterium]|nr:sigma-70 family RNA polymerase sigma factor [Bryobacterales bacterium]